MPKKTGKGRLDKYYKLAKEQGYRARSAFKLIQLNKKYAFLESSRCTIDLCAAPGGWLQVASKYMPVNSIIVGIDLIPIKPIPRVTTFAADITSPHCRNFIRSELKDWKADVVLHDGAPNVGTAWVQDAYSQSELVLMSLKLAVEFLTKGGTFVTKIFRSVDYNNLIWVFNQLFAKVEATKPPSSRNVSAEIFVVCRDFLAPKYIDPKFLDPRHVFKEVSAPESPTGKGIHLQANVFHPEKKRRQREGYTDGDYTLHKSIPAGDFIRGRDPVAMLGSANQLSFVTDEEKQWLNIAATSEDVKANCEDLKVLGRSDFKTLMKWRVALREELGLENRSKHVEEHTEIAENDEVDDDQKIIKELERLNAEAAARTKRNQRRANEIKQRTIQRMQLQMTAPLDIGLDQQDPALSGKDDIFDLNTTESVLGKRRGTLGQFTSEDADLEQSSEGEQRNEETVDESDIDPDEAKVERLDTELDAHYEEYQNRLREKDAKLKVREARKNSAMLESWSGIQEGGDSSDHERSDGEDGGWEWIQQTKEASSDEDSSMDEDHGTRPEGEPNSISASEPRTKRTRLMTKLESNAPVSKVAHIWFSQDIFTGVDDEDMEENRMDLDEDEPEDNSEHTADFEVVPQENDDMWVAEHEDADEAKRAHVQRFGLITPEAVTLAQKLVNRQTTAHELINHGFNRYSLNSKEDLPSWFLDDEAKHYKSNIPITKEAMSALREKQRALDARPIKKIAEAKARKKIKAQQRLEKALKKAEGINTTGDLTEREKAQQIEKLMRRGMSKNLKSKNEVKVVVSKGAHKGIKGRPKGIKGRYRMVDARMRKELRAKKRSEKANKKRRK